MTKLQADSMYIYRIFIVFVCTTFVSVTSHGNSKLATFRSYQGTISSSSCENMTSTHESVIHCGRRCSDSSNCSAFVLGPEDACSICDTVEGIEFNTTGQFFLRHPTVVHPRQNESVFMPGGLRVGQLIELKTRVSSVDPGGGTCMEFDTGDSTSRGDDVALGFWTHFSLSHIHREAYVGGHWVVRDKDFVNDTLNFDTDFTISFLVGESDFRIYMDGYLYFTFKHIVKDLSTIQYFCLACNALNECDRGVISDSELRF